MLPKDFILAQIMFLARYRDYGEYMTSLPLSSSSQTLFFFMAEETMHWFLSLKKKLCRILHSWTVTWKAALSAHCASALPLSLPVQLHLDKWLMHHVGFFLSSSKFKLSVKLFLWKRFPFPILLTSASVCIRSIISCRGGARCFLSAILLLYGFCSLMK